MGRNDEPRSVGEELLRANAELSHAVEERDRLLAELVEAEKLAAMGRLVAGLAHELNTPLGVLLTALSMTQANARRLQAVCAGAEIDEDDLRALAAQLVAGVDLSLANVHRATHLVDGLRRVSAAPTHRKERFSVLSALREAAREIEAPLRK